MKWQIYVFSGIILMCGNGLAAAQNTNDNQLLPDNFLDQRDSESNVIPEAVDQGQNNSLINSQENIISTPLDEGNSFAEETLRPVETIMKILFFLVITVVVIFLVTITIHAVSAIRYILIKSPPDQQIGKMDEDSGNADNGPVTESPAERAEDQDSR